MNSLLPDDDAAPKKPRRPWSHLSDHAPLAAEIHL